MALDETHLLVLEDLWISLLLEVLNSFARKPRTEAYYLRSQGESASTWSFRFLYLAQAQGVRITINSELKFSFSTLKKLCLHHTIDFLILIDFFLKRPFACKSNRPFAFILAGCSLSLIIYHIWLS